MTDEEVVKARDFALAEIVKLSDSYRDMKINTVRLCRLPTPTSETPTTDLTSRRYRAYSDSSTSWYNSCAVESVVVRFYSATAGRAMLQPCARDRHAAFLIWTSSVCVCFRPPSLSAQARCRSERHGFVPHTQHVNLRAAGQTKLVESSRSDQRRQS